MSRLQVKQLNDLVSEADEIVKVSNPDAIILTLNLFQKSDHMQDKEREVVQLSELVDRDRMLIKVAVFLIYMDFLNRGQSVSPTHLLQIGSYQRGGLTSPHWVQIPIKPSQRVRSTNLLLRASGFGKLTKYRAWLMRQM